jgi:hypothetical protein
MAFKNFSDKKEGGERSTGSKTILLMLQMVTNGRRKKLLDHTGVNLTD